MNSVPTAHVILGIDSGAEEGRDAFLAFEEARKASAGGLVSNWYKANKRHIVLSTLDNSELVKFNHSFNISETTDQGLFVFELMDPNNTFERNFFNRFFTGLENYSEVIDSYLANGKIDYMRAIRSTLKNRIFLGGTGTGLEDLGKESKRELPSSAGGLSQEFAKYAQEISLAPYLKTLFITFGVGDDIVQWSPVQKAQLVTLHYEHTAEGVKKYIIKCVSSAGLLGLGESQKTEQYVKATARTEYRSSVPYILNEPGDSSLWRARNPVYVVTQLLTQLLGSVLREPPFILFQDLEKVLQARWSKAVVNYFKQKTDVFQKTHLPQDSPRWNDTFDTDQWAIAMAQEITNTPSVPLRAVEGGGTALGLGDPGAVARREDLATAGFFVNDPARGLEAKELDDLAGNYLANQKKRGLLGPGIGEDALAKNREWMNSIQDRRGNASRWEDQGREEWVSGFQQLAGGGVGVPNVAIAQFGHGRQHAEGPHTSLKWKQTSPGILPGHIEEYLNSLTTGGSPISFRDYKHLKEEAAEYFHKNYVALENVKIDSKELYAIYKTAGAEFFKSLGFTLVEHTRDPITAVRAINLYGHGGDQSSIHTFKNESNILKPLDVELVKKSSEEVNNALGVLLREMNLDPEDEPIIIGFSEISLVEKFRHSDAAHAYYRHQMGLPSVWNAGDNPLSTLKTVVLATSIRILSSLTNGVSLTDLVQRGTISSQLYSVLLDLFKNFKKEEPPISLTDAPEFSTLFSNPELETTRLPGQTTGVPNYLTVFGSLEKLGRKEPFRTQKDFRKFLSEKRIPVFNYGFKNSNVLSVDFNLRPWYAYFLDVIPTTTMTGLISSALRNEPAMKTVLSYYNKAGDPKEEIDKAIDKYFENNVETSVEDLQKAVLGAPGAEPPTRGAWERWEWLQSRRSNALDQEAGATKVSSIGANMNAVRSLGALGMASGDDLPSFREVVKAYIKLTLSSPSLSQKLVVNPEMQSASQEKILSMRRKLATRVFTGSITTLPLFSIISPAKTISSRSLLYFVEPEFMLSPIEKNSTLRSTWLSGEYYIVGYEVEFSGSEITTKFDVVKNPDKAQGVTA